MTGRFDQSCFIRVVVQQISTRTTVRVTWLYNVMLDNLHVVDNQVFVDRYRHWLQQGQKDEKGIYVISGFILILVSDSLNRTLMSTI